MYECILNARGPVSRESGGQIQQALLTALKVGGGMGDETGSFGFFRVVDGMMDKCLLAVLLVGS